MAEEHFDKLKNIFNKSVTSINVKTSEMLETAKLNTYIGTLQNEIQNAKYTLGDKAYALWSEGHLSSEEVQSECVDIRQKEAEIEQTRQKITELEEQSRRILGEKNSLAAKSVPVYQCPHCGAMFNKPANFCKKCGGKMINS